MPKNAKIGLNLAKLHGEKIFLLILTKCGRGSAKVKTTTL